MNWETPITDRTVEQTVEARNNQSNAEHNKGAWNYPDLNRIENNYKYIIDQLLTDSYHIPHKYRNYKETIMEVVKREEGAIDDNTLLLLHGEDFSDSSGNEVSITNNGVTVSTTQSKFGEKSLYFDGSTSYLKITELIPTNGDFTVDWWEYCTGNSATRFAQSINGGCGGLCVGGGYDNNILYVSASGTTWDIVNGLDAFNTTLNNWVHWAVVRNGDIWTIYRNGTKYASTTNSGIIYSNGSGLIIGSFLYDANHYFCGYIDELRVSNVARWTENFTPPNEPYGTIKIIEELITETKEFTDWNENNIPYKSEIDRIRRNHNNLVSLFLHDLEFSEIPYGNYLDFEEANILEKIELRGKEMFENMQKSYIPCGAITSGGDLL